MVHDPGKASHSRPTQFQAVFDYGTKKTPERNCLRRNCFQVWFYVSEMTIDFYYLLGSAPCRSVMLGAKALGVELNLKEVDIMKGEHLTPEFIKVYINFVLFEDENMLDACAPDITSPI